MIQNFKDRGLKRFFEHGDKQRIPQELAGKIATILNRLDGATNPQEMKSSGYRLHPLKGDRQGFWAVWVSKNRRIVFRFEDGHARDVELIDYH